MKNQQNEGDRGAMTHQDLQSERKIKIEWLDPTPEMLLTPEFEAVWKCIRLWDINVPGAYGGYCGATGNHVRAILDALVAAKAAMTPTDKYAKCPCGCSYPDHWKGKKAMSDKYAERAREICKNWWPDPKFIPESIVTHLARALEQSALEARIDEIRCSKTHDLCGTDTVMVGWPCSCTECKRWNELRARLAELEKKET